jgi:hypothetical protein
LRQHTVASRFPLSNALLPQAQLSRQLFGSLLVSIEHPRKIS